LTIIQEWYNKGMKNIPLSYSIVIVIVIVILIAAIVNRSGNEGAPVSQTPSASQVTSSGSPAPSGTAVVPTAGAPVKVVPSNLNYKDYITQLRAYQDACNTAATSQFKQLYGSLGAASYNSYYNQVNGVCYMRASGTIQPAYSTTTTAHIYFRNVTSKSLVAECIDTTGTMADASWACTNKVTGASINKAAFEALVTAYTTTK
jgi:hypothetical protein